jgi:hypothetical protein
MYFHTTQYTSWLNNIKIVLEGTSISHRHRMITKIESEESLTNGQRQRGEPTPSKKRVFCTFSGDFT